ncbi:hemin uptake protein HemP [Mesorhizobium sp. M1307]|uniref:hemin uptake protein HemP n=1 Tax=unclassified Mesorhizobium TaxID=325217 RepID=UPI00333553BA
MGCHRHVPARRFSRGCDAARTLSSDALFTGQQQIRIEHFGAPYRLKIPGQGS